MSTMDRRLIGFIFGILFVLIFINFFMVREQQKTFKILMSNSAATVEHEQSQKDRIWNLHHQVKALGKEDERLLAHIKWFVMRRSGTDELRKMETAIAKLEAAE